MSEDVVFFQPVAAGIVSEGGDTIRARGCVFSRISTGHYSIEFDPRIPGGPGIPAVDCVAVLSTRNTDRFISFENTSDVTKSIRTTNSLGSPRDSEFNFKFLRMGASPPGAVFLQNICGGTVDGVTGQPRKVRGCTIEKFEGGGNALYEITLDPGLPGGPGINEDQFVSEIMATGNAPRSHLVQHLSDTLKRVGFLTHTGSFPGSQDFSFIFSRLL